MNVSLNLVEWLIVEIRIYAHVRQSAAQPQKLALSFTPL